MIPYIIHVSVLLAVFYTFYWLLLRKETFYKLNRFVLIGSLVLSFSLPLIHIPASMSLHSIIMEEPVADAIIPEMELEAVRENKSHENIRKEELIHKEEIMPLEESKESISLFSTIQSWGWSKILWAIYGIGVAIFSITFLIQFFVILFSRINLKFIQDGKYRIYEMSKETPPFSFLNWIFINPTLYDLEAFNQILEHEKIHVSQAHSIDKLLAEFIIIFNWFNPFAWLYRKTINNNIEFLTDQEMLKKGTEKQSYQMNLLRISVPQHALTLTTNYNESFLKERIGMMNSKKSSARSSWKYLMVLPLILFTVMSLNAIQKETGGNLIPEIEDSETLEKVIEGKTLSEDEKEKPILNQSPSDRKTNEVIAEEKNEKEEQKNEVLNEAGNPLGSFSQSESNVGEVESEKLFGKDFPMPESERRKLEELAQLGDVFKESFQGLPFDGDEVVEEVMKSMNGNNITMTTTTTTSSKPKNSCDDKKKSSCDTSKKKSSCNTDKKKSSCNPSGVKLNPGEWFAKIEENEVCFHMNRKTRKKQIWEVAECFSRNSLGSLPRYSSGSFIANRDPGKIVFTGKFSGNTGEGDFTFKESNEFISFLKNEQIGSITLDELFLMYLNNTSKQYIRGLKSRGYDVDVEDVLELGVHEVSLDFIDRLKKEGYKDLSLDKIIEFSIHGIQPDFISELKKLGYKNVSGRDVVNLKNHGVSVEYLRNLKDLGYGADRMRINKVIEFAIHGVNSDYLKKIKKIGYGSDNLSPNKVVEFAVHGVGSEYLKKLKALGYGSEMLSPSKVVEFAVHGVNSEYITNLTNLGYGADNLPPNKLIEFAVHGIMSKYVKSLKDEGYNSLSPSDIIKGAIHGLDTRYIGKLKSMGVRNLSYDKLIEAQIHGVTSRFIQEAKSNGAKSDDLSDFIQMKIHGIY